SARSTGGSPRRTSRRSTRSSRATASTRRRSAGSRTPEEAVMSDVFVPLTPRIGAKVMAPRERVLDPAFADECNAALERYGVLLFPRVGFDDAEQVAFSRNLGEVVPQG